MPDDHGVHRWAVVPGPDGEQALRGLTVAETRELAALQALMRNDADMTEMQRRRWFELSHRHDLARG